MDTAIQVGARIFIDFEEIGFDMSKHYIVNHNDGDPFTVMDVGQYGFRTKEIRGLMVGPKAICGEDYHWLFPNDIIINDASPDIQVEACVDMFL